jgi:hypothetical protein
MLEPYLMLLKRNPHLDSAGFQAGAVCSPTIYAKQQPSACSSRSTPEGFSLVLAGAKALLEHNVTLYQIAFQMGWESNRMSL